MQKPKRLQRGDKVAFVSLSRGMLGHPRFIHRYETAKLRLERDYGLEVIPMPHALADGDFLYCHPEARAKDLMDAFRDPSIRAVFCAIGGDDTIRLLPYIDFDVLRDNPKIFTGYSDSTVNHFMMHKAGLVSYYGLAVMTTLSEYVAVNEYTRTSMEQILFDPRPSLAIPCSSFCSYETDKVWWNEANRNTPTPRFPNTGYEILQGSGTAEGELLGGCMDVFLQLFGTSLWPSPEEWRGKLLLLETSEWDMDPLLFTWILRNLAAQGLFRVLSGILVGKPAYREKEDAYKAALLQVIGKEAGCPDLPILWNVNAGHAYPTGVFPLGLRYRIDCEARQLRLLEPAAE